MRTDTDVSHHFADLGEVLMHYVLAGQGPAVVLLHGWPQTWWEWRHVIPRLAETYTVIAPDMRVSGTVRDRWQAMTNKPSPTISGCSSPSGWATAHSFWLATTGAGRSRSRWLPRIRKRCAGLSSWTWSSRVQGVISRKA